VAVDRGGDAVAAMRLAAMRPVQVASLAVGLWWVANGIGAFLVDPNFATGRVHGSGELLGVQITANGWHALFHLLPGIVGIAAARRPRAALAYLLVAGALYIAVGAWGLIAGGTSVGLIAVDRAGDVVHLIEGLIALAAGVLMLELERSPSAAPARVRAG
jgi:hypothetical protein